VNIVTLDLRRTMHASSGLMWQHLVDCKYQ